MIHRRRNSHRRFRYSLDFKKKVLQSIRLIGIGKTMRKMDVKKDQVKYWMKKEQEIMSTPSEDSAGRYRLSKTAYGDIAQEEQQLFEWIMARKKNGENVLNDEIIERATTVFCGLPEAKTKASRKWLVSFKRRFGLAKEPPLRKVQKTEAKEEAPHKPPWRLKRELKPKEEDVQDDTQDDLQLLEDTQDESVLMIDADDSDLEIIGEVPGIITLDD